MKKTAAFLLAGLIALMGISACKGNNEGSGEKSTATPATSAPVDTDKPTDAPQSPTDAPQGEGIKLVTDGSRLGVLQKASEKNDYVIKGLIVTTDSGHHDYPAIEELIEQGYKTEGLYAEFELNEWFAVYADVEGNKAADVYIVANDASADYSKMKAADVAALSEAEAYPLYFEKAAPDAAEHGKLLVTYVNGEMSEGLYNVFFTFEGEIAYMLQLKLTPMSIG